MVSRHGTYVRWIALLFGLVFVLLVPGYAISRRLGGDEAVVGMFWGCGLCFVAAAAAGLPQLLVAASPARETGLMLGALGIRMGLTLFGALAIVLAAPVSKTPFLLWVAVSYIVFLVADVVFVLTRRRDTPR